MVFILSDSMASDLALLPFIQRHRDAVQAIFVVPYVWFSSFRLLRKTTSMVRRAPLFYMFYKMVEVYLYRGIRFCFSWDSVYRLGSRTGISIRRLPDVNNEAFIDELDRLDPDLLITMSPQIYRSEIVSRFEGRLFNVHHALLPEYRGAFAGNFWTLVNGAATSGVTVHLIETGIDSGAIAAREILQIENNDSVYSLHARCAQLSDPCLEKLFKEWSPEVKLVLIPQNERNARTYSFPALSAYQKLRARKRRLLRLRDLLAFGVLRPSI